jgi:hypothetical protein
MFGRFRWNDAAARLGSRQSDLDLDITRDESVVGKHFPPPLMLLCALKLPSTSPMLIEYFQRRSRARISEFESSHPSHAVRSLWHAITPNPDPAA